MLVELVYLWIVSSTGDPLMKTYHKYESRVECQNEIHRLELNYYRDRLPHKVDINGKRYYMSCLTNQEVIDYLDKKTIDKVI